MKKIVIINGTGGTGKDTFINLVSKRIKTYNFDSVGKIKEMARVAGWDGTKDKKARNFLAKLKEITTEYNDLPWNDMRDAIQKFNNSDDEIMFIHIREPENIARAVKEFDIITLLLKRPSISDFPNSLVDSNEFVEDYDYDYVIENNDLETLDKQVDKFLNEI